MSVLPSVFPGPGHLAYVLALLLPFLVHLPLEMEWLSV
jgi:hypothetical protein